ncbi:hypothetical protein SLS61_004931 [Didymella pomorum]
MDASEQDVVVKVFDLKPLLLLDKEYAGLHVHVMDFQDTEEPDEHRASFSILKTFNTWYLVSSDTFYEYIIAVTSKLGMCGDDGGGAFVFEVRVPFWEDWMGLWTRTFSPQYAYGIAGYGPDLTLQDELIDAVIAWGRQCGLDLGPHTGDIHSIYFQLEGTTWQAEKSPLQM